MKSNKIEFSILSLFLWFTVTFHNFNRNKKEKKSKSCSCRKTPFKTASGDDLSCFEKLSKDIILKYIILYVHCVSGIIDWGWCILPPIGVGGDVEFFYLSWSQHVLWKTNRKKHVLWNIIVNCDHLKSTHK